MHMSSLERNVTLKSALADAARLGTRVRLYGSPMVILAEGIVAYVGNGIVAIKHSPDTEPEEFVLLASIVKLQLLAEYRHY